MRTLINFNTARWEHHRLADYLAHGERPLPWQPRRANTAMPVLNSEESNGVSSPWVDDASAAAQTMEWPAKHVLIDLLQRTVVVLNDSDGRADKRTRTILVQQFADHGLVVIEVPFDPHLRRGGVIDVAHDMSSKTPRRFYEIAVATADHFNSTTQRLGEQRSRDPMRVSAMIPDRGPTALQQVHPAQPEWNPSLEIRRPWKVLRTVTSAAVEGY